MNTWKVVKHLVVGCALGVAFMLATCLLLS